MKSQTRNAWTGLTAGRVDLCWSYGRGDLDPDFAAANAETLAHEKGAGYWLWKPYVIADALRRAADGDAIFYADSGGIFIRDVARLVRYCRDETPGVLGFSTDRLPERHWTKRDAFVLMDCDRPDFHESSQLQAGFSVFIANDFARDFAADWLRHAEDPRILTNRPNECGLDNLPGFKSHRHDQSVFSLLYKKRNLKPAPRIGAFRTFRLVRVDVRGPADWLRPWPRLRWIRRWLRPVSPRRWRRPTHERLE